MMPKILSAEEGSSTAKRVLKHLKKLPSVIFVLFLAIGVPISLYLVNQGTNLRTGAAPGNTVLSMVPLTASIGIGETSDIAVLINPSVDSVSSLQLVMTYDPAVVQVLDIVPSSFFTEPAAQVGPPLVIQKDLSVPGVIRYAVSFPLTNPLHSSSSVLEAVKISVKGLTQGSSQFAFTTTGTFVTKVNDSGNSNVLKTATGNTVNVVGGTRLLFGAPSPLNPQAVDTSFTLPVLMNTDNQQVDAVDAIIRFDPSVFRVTSAVKPSTSAFSSYPSLSVDNDAGAITISANIGSGSTTEPVVGNNIVLATLTVVPKINTTGSQFSYDFTAGSRNDSNLVAHVTTTGQETTDILAGVSPVTITVGAEAVATAAPSATAVATSQPSSSPIVEEPVATSSPAASASPEASADPTTAPALVPQSITFNLRLQGRSRAGATPVSTVTFIYKALDNADTAVHSSVLTPNSSNQITATMLPGKYIFLLKGPGYLGRRYGSTQVPIEITPTTTTVDFTNNPLLGGDFNADGTVNEVDYSLKFLTSFAKDDSLVDLDGSGQVNNLDYGVMRSNWSLNEDDL